MTKSLMLIIITGILMLSCSNKPKNQTAQVSEVPLRWVGIADNQFKEDLESAFERLNRFLEGQNLLQKPVQIFVDEVIHFESKELFDSEMKRLTNGQMKTVPKTYVAVGDNLRSLSGRHKKGPFLGHHF